MLTKKKEVKVVNNIDKAVVDSKYLLGRSATATDLLLCCRLPRVCRSYWTAAQGDPPGSDRRASSGTHFFLPSLTPCKDKEIQLA